MLGDIRERVMPVRSIRGGIEAIQTQLSELKAVQAAGATAEQSPARLTLSELAYFDREPKTGPYVFSSTVCRTDHFLMPLYDNWVRQFAQKPRLHRKQWEFVYISQVLHERGYLKPGSCGLGFGVGKEPLADLYCSYGCEIVATDLAPDEAVGTGWVETNQHASTKDGLYRGISDREDFDRRVAFRPANMNAIPNDLRDFDFCYSSCSIEHVGSLDLSKAFLANALKVLKPGGISVHTTEYNLTSNDDTLTEGSTVYWRRRDFEEVAASLRASGHFVEPLDFYPGSGVIDTYIDMPPYTKTEPHLRLQLPKYACTSFGFVVRKARGAQ